MLTSGCFFATLSDMFHEVAEGLVFHTAINAIVHVVVVGGVRRGGAKCTKDNLLALSSFPNHNNGAHRIYPTVMHRASHMH